MEQKKYRLSKVNIPERFCSEIDNWFLIEDEEGKDIDRLCEKFYDILIGLMNYRSLLRAIESQNKNDEINE